MYVTDIRMEQCGPDRSNRYTGRSSNDDSFPVEVTLRIRCDYDASEYIRRNCRPGLEDRGLEQLVVTMGGSVAPAAPPPGVYVRDNYGGMSSLDDYMGKATQAALASTEGGTKGQRLARAIAKNGPRPMPDFERVEVPPAQPPPPPKNTRPVIPAAPKRIIELEDDDGSEDR